MKGRRLSMKNRKIVIGIITLILSIIGMISLSICNLASENVKYSFKLDEYVTLKSVFINNNNIPLKSLVSQSENLTYDEEKNELIGMGEAEVAIKASSIDNVYIEFSDVENYNIVFKKNGINQELVGHDYSYNISMFNIISRCFNGYSVIYFVLLLPLMYFSVYSIYNFFNKAKENEMKLKNVIFFILSVFMICFVTFYITLATSEILLLLVLIAVLGTGIYFLRENIKENIQNVFIYMATIIGIAMLFLIPPFNVPDESSHFTKSFIMADHIKVSDNGYADIPRFVEAFSNKYLHSVHKSGIKYDGVNYFSDIYLGCKYYNLEETDLTNVNYTNTRYLPVLPYLPSVGVMFIGKHLSFSPMLLLIISRFLDLFIVLVLAYVAINITPKFKKIFFIVCLFPIFLQQASAINQDYLTNISCILFVAYVLKCKYSENFVKTKDKLILLLIGIIIACCKFGYFPITLTIFLIPNKKFESKREAILLKIGILAFVLVLSYILSIYRVVKLEDITNKFYSIDYIFKHPIDSIKIFFNTFIIRLQSDVLCSLADGFLYSTVSHKATLNFIVIFCYLALIFVYDENNAKLNKKERIIFIITSIAIFGIVYLAAFSNWTEIGSRTISGIQSRYFIPAVLTLYMGISSSLIKFKSKNNNLVYCNIMIIVYSITIFTIITSVYR